MNLLVSKALLFCMLALAAKFCLAKNDPGCVEEARKKYREEVRDITDRMMAVDHKEIIRNTRLYKDTGGDIDIDYGDTSYLFEENSTEVTSQFSSPASPHITASWGEAEVRLEVSESGQTSLFLIVSNSTLNCTVKLDTERLHGNLVLHPVFFTLSFSDDGKYLAYVAEALLDHHAPYQPNIGGVGWMKKVYRPRLFLLAVAGETVREVDTGGLAVGQTVWLEDSTRLVSVVRPPTWSPCPQCTDYSTRLLLININTGHTQLITSEDHHVSVPRVVPGHNAIVFFRNSLTVLHHNVTIPNSINAPQSLVALSLTDYKETVIIDETRELEDIGKMYPNLVNPWPHRMFLKVTVRCSLFYRKHFSPGRQRVPVQLRHQLQHLRGGFQERSPWSVCREGQEGEGVGCSGQ